MLLLLLIKCLSHVSFGSIRCVRNNDGRVDGFGRPRGRCARSRRQSDSVACRALVEHGGARRRVYRVRGGRRAGSGALVTLGGLFNCCIFAKCRVYLLFPVVVFHSNAEIADRGARDTVCASHEMYVCLQLTTSIFSLSLTTRTAYTHHTQAGGDTAHSGRVIEGLSRYGFKPTAGPAVY